MRTRHRGGKKVSQCAATLHNSLAVLIYRLADLAPSQGAIAFVIFELQPRQRDMGRVSKFYLRADRGLRVVRVDGRNREKRGGWASLGCSQSVSDKNSIDSGRSNR